MKEWYSPAELAELALPGMPATHAAISRLAEVQGWRKPELEWHGERNLKGIWRRRNGRGGGYEYRYDVLPQMARARLICDQEMAAKPARPDLSDVVIADRWRWYDGLPSRKKQAAEYAQQVLLAIDAAEVSGIRTDQAIRMIVREQRSRGRKISDRTIYNWKSRIAGVPKAHWLPSLAPRHAGRTVEKECDPRAWDILYVDYFRSEAPDYTDCYRRLDVIAGMNGWYIPSERTLKRRIDAVPRVIHVLNRQGMDELKKLYPAQIRDRSPFHALEGLVSDGHMWDLEVEWYDGTIVRPTTVAFQDLYSGNILSWRHDVSETKELILLAFGDVVENFGIPTLCWLDNGRAFASKAVSGGTPNRYRYKVKETDPCGALTALGVEIHWTQPYSGQSKPIERTWRDFARSIAKHPNFAGAYVGNKPGDRKKYGTIKPVPYDVFLKTVAEGIVEHNARKGRRSRICGGKLSFDDVFNASYAKHAVTKATPEQCRMWLLSSETVKVRKNAQVALHGNTYWHHDLTDMIGEPVVLRFDPDILHDVVHVYRLDGSYACTADCIEATGFADAAKARTHAKARKKWLKAVREMDEAERTLTIDDLAAMLPATEAAPRPDAKVVRAAKIRAGNRKSEPVTRHYEEFGRGLAATYGDNILPYQKKSDAA